MHLFPCGRRSRVFHAGAVKQVAVVHQHIVVAAVRHAVQLPAIAHGLQIRRPGQIHPVFVQQAVKRPCGPIFIEPLQRRRGARKKHIDLLAAHKQGLHFLVIIGVRIAGHPHAHPRMRFLKRFHQPPVVADLVIVPQGDGERLFRRCGLPGDGRAAAGQAKKRQQRQNPSAHAHPSRFWFLNSPGLMPVTRLNTRPK